MLDDADYETIAAFRWSFSGHGYAMRKERRSKTVYMHRALAGATTGQIVDHIDGNTLNNQRSNLRLTSKSGNAWNLHRGHCDGSSNYVGVSRHRNKWRAQICTNGKSRHIGVFETELAAARAYSDAAKQDRRL